MNGLNKSTRDLQHRTAARIKHAIEDPSPQTEAAIRWALDRLEEVNVPDVAHAVVLTLTGKKKAAKQARKSAETALRRAERKLRGTDRGPGKAWLAAGFLAAATAAALAALAWRRRQHLAASAEPKTEHAADPDE
ncbi:hypothetical protein ACX801_04400 [Arthrobacter bambusae]